jgi:hypothetical protein
MGLSAPLKNTRSPRADKLATGECAVNGLSPMCIVRGTPENPTRKTLENFSQKRHHRWVTIDAPFVYTARICNVSC